MEEDISRTHLVQVLSPILEKRLFNRPIRFLSELSLPLFENVECMSALAVHE